MNTPDWLALMLQAGWTFRICQAERGFFPEHPYDSNYYEWKHAKTGKVLTELSKKDFELLKAHREAGTTPPPF